MLKDVTISINAKSLERVYELQQEIQNLSFQLMSKCSELSRYQLDPVIKIKDPEEYEVKS